MKKKMKMGYYMKKPKDKTNSGMDSYVFMQSEHHLGHYEDYYLQENGVYPDDMGKTYPHSVDPHSRYQNLKDFKADKCEIHDKQLSGWICDKCEDKLLKSLVKK